MKAYLFSKLAIAGTLWWIVCSCNDKEIPAPGNDHVNAKIELPASLPITQIQIYEAGGNAVAVNDDGTFYSASAQLLAVDKAYRMIYFSYCSVDTLPYSGTVTLNALETATSFLLHAIPHSFEPVSQQQFGDLKRFISNLPATQWLALAIDDAIKARNYLKIDDIEQELQVATRALYEQNGISDFLASVQSSTQTPALKAGTALYSVKQQGFRLDLTNKSIAGLQNWVCAFTAYNAWGCYLGIVPGILTGESQKNVYIMTDIQYVIPPMNASGFQGKITDLDSWTDFYPTVSWNTQKQYWTELYHTMTRDDFETDSRIWDKCKPKDFQMRLAIPQDAIVIISPRDSPYLLAYNVIRLVAQPVVRSIFKGVESADKETDFVDKFCRKLVSDQQFFRKMDAVDPDMKGLIIHLMENLRDHIIASDAGGALFSALPNETARKDALEATLSLCSTIEKWVAASLDATLANALLWKFETFTIDPQLTFDLTPPSPFSDNVSSATTCAEGS
jgi:hypothetical protein